MLHRWAGIDPLRKWRVRRNIRSDSIVEAVLVYRGDAL